MNFEKYQKVRRFGTVDTEGIEVGTCYVFPKIDGTNASTWLGDDESIYAGSRNRTLSLDNDNAEFYAWVLQQDNIINFHLDNPHLRLYGEWLVPHSLKTYRDEAWRNFYVFDVVNEDGQYLHYDKYKPLLEKYEIEYIAPLGIIKNGKEENFLHYLPKNNYLIEDGKGEGEGIVIKNYDFINKFGRVQWGKIVTSKFKEKNHKEMGAPSTEIKRVESDIVDSYVTEGRVEKIYQKICTQRDGWRSQYIPQLLNTVYYDLISEETWNFLKEHNNPNIDFTNLKQQTIVKIKQHKGELF